MNVPNNTDVDKILVKRKWTLALNLCLKKSINQRLLKYLLSDTQYEIGNFIEELKDYDDLYFVENIDNQNANETWNKIIDLLNKKSFSSSFLNKNEKINEIIYLLERLQNAEDKLLKKIPDVCRVNSIWNNLVKMFSKEIFSTDQQALEFFNQFTNGLDGFNYSNNAFFLARLHLLFVLCSTNQLPTQQEAFSDQPIYIGKIDKESINFMWNIICRMFSNKIFLSIHQTSEFLNKFAKGIVNLNEAENAFLFARLKVAIILCENFQSFSPHQLQQEISFLNERIYNDRLLSEEEKICLYNYLQNDYKNDIG
ncbi:25116_t:CDS:2, partial [Gigaspora margarita]